MATVHPLPRDQLDWLFKLARRAVRYWWVCIPVTILGVAATAYVVKQRQPSYLSQAVVHYQEPANINLVDGGPGGRKMGNRLKETVMARARIAALIEELDLEPELRAAGNEGEAVEEVRRAIGFRINEGDIYVVSFRASSPALAQKGAQRLTDTLIDENTRLRAEQAEIARGFLDTERERNEQTLRAKELELAKFLAKHPEFAAEGAVAGPLPGAAVRATSKQQVGEVVSAGEPLLLALRREELRLRRQLAAPGTRAGVDPGLAKAKTDADARLASARRDLADRRQKFTEQHPDVRAAAAAVAQAEDQARQAEEALGNPAAVVAEKPLDADAKAALASRLAQVQQEIRGQQGRKPTAGAKVAASTSDAAQRIVAAETEWTQIYRELTEARERYEALDSRQFAATLTASSLATGRVARIVVIDPAFRPSRPEGTSKTRVFAAGVAVSLVLAVLAAVVLGIFDDRLYDRRDVERLGLVPLLIEVPARRKAHG